MRGSPAFPLSGAMVVARSDAPAPDPHPAPACGVVAVASLGHVAMARHHSCRAQNVCTIRSLLALMRWQQAVRESKQLHHQRNFTTIPVEEVFAPCVADGDRTFEEAACHCVDHA